MRKIIAWVMARPTNALVAVSTTGVFGLLITPLLVVSLALTALVTMRLGGRRGLMIITGGVAFIGVLTYLVQQAISADALVLAVLWGMAWGLSLVYRRWAQLSWVVIAAGVIGVLLVIGVYVFAPDPGVMWLALLNETVRPALIEAQLLSSDAELDELLAGMARIMTGALAALISVVLVTSMLLGRWWQAVLYNPGGFRKEFHVLRLGRVMAVIMLSLIAASLLGRFPLATDIATVVWLLFFFQGIAVVHALVATVGMSIGWLVSIYLLIMLMPYYASPVLAGLGFVDAWFDFRRRVISKNSK